jgi:repressor LexA
MEEGLDARKVEILRLLALRSSEGQNPPSVREAGAAAGLKSSRSAHAHLKKLEERGYVERSGSGARTAKLTEKGWRVTFDGAAPLMGTIAAGRGLEAVAVEEPFSFVAEVLGAWSGRGRMILRAVGDSMTGAGIEEGDLLVVEENPSPPDGSRVVAELLSEGAEPEGTVKRLYREGGMLRLKPESDNGDHQDILVPASKVRVRGTVEWVIKPMNGRKR